MQKLLADRFSLKFHREKRSSPCTRSSPERAARSSPKLRATRRRILTCSSIFTRIGPAKFDAKNATMADFAGFLQRGVLDRPVIDQTGLTGRFDFGLLWRPEVPAGAAGTNPAPSPSDGDGLPDIFTAIQQQLGLKLEAMKTPIDVIVIDHLEKPAEN